MCRFTDCWEKEVKPICNKLIDDKFIDLFTTPKLHGEEKEYVLETMSHLYDPYGMLAISYMRSDIDIALKNGDIKSARNHAKSVAGVFSNPNYWDKFYGDDKCNEYRLRKDLVRALDKLIGIKV